MLNEFSLLLNCKESNQETFDTQTSCSHAGENVLGASFEGFLKAFYNKARH